MAPEGPHTHRQRLICEQQGPGYGAGGQLIEYMQSVCVCACVEDGRGGGGDLAAITKFISIHVFRSWLMGALPSERCADRMGRGP